MVCRACFFSPPPVDRALALSEGTPKPPPKVGSLDEALDAMSATLLGGGPFGDDDERDDDPLAALLGGGRGGGAFDEQLV